MLCATSDDTTTSFVLGSRFGGVFRDDPHFQQFLLRLHSVQHLRTAMFENTVAIIDFVVSIVLVVTTAKWAARRTNRIKAVLFTCAVRAVYSVTTDFALSFFVSFYDRSLSSLAISFLLSLPIDAAIALFVTRRRAALAHA
jgi:hypothetical protein